MSDAASLGEDGFIAALRALAKHPAARNLEDDCAVLDIGGESLVLTHDMISEGIHVLAGQDMADVGWKLVATNVSDLAAKGAAPIGALLGAMLGSDDQRFITGLGEALAAWNMELLGGDTIRGLPGSPRSFGLTAIGRATCRPVPSRAGARPGDIVWITGPVGAAMIGFEILRERLAQGQVNALCDDDPHTLAYRRPRALLDEGIVLAPLVSAMMDISDGLLLDASRLARASNVTITISSTSVPLASPEARREDALRWGDDYQLLFTLPHHLIPPVSAFAIGEVLPAGAAPLLCDGHAPKLGNPLGYHH